MELEATRLRNCWAIRPKGQLGSMGWYPKPWAVQFVKANSADEAIAKAKRVYGPWPVHRLHGEA